MIDYYIIKSNKNYNLVQKINTTFKFFKTPQSPKSNKILQKSLFSIPPSHSLGLHFLHPSLDILSSNLHRPILPPNIPLRQKANS